MKLIYNINTCYKGKKQVIIPYSILQTYFFESENLIFYIFIIILKSAPLSF